MNEIGLILTDVILNVLLVTFYYWREKEREGLWWGRGEVVPDVILNRFYSLNDMQICHRIIPCLFNKVYGVVRYVGAWWGWLNHSLPSCG